MFEKVSFPAYLDGACFLLSDRLSLQVTMDRFHENLDADLQFLLKDVHWDVHRQRMARDARPLLSQL